MSDTLRSGLEGVVAARTRMSHVGGEKGELILGGLDVEQAADTRTYEFMANRLMRLARPDAVELGLGKARVEAWEWLGTRPWLVESADGMAALRAVLASAPQERNEHAGFLQALVGVASGFWWRRQMGLSPVAPDAFLNFCKV